MDNFDFDNLLRGRAPPSEEQHRLAGLIKFIRNGSNVQRWHTERRLSPETNGHHQHGVLMLAFILSDKKPSANLLMACAAHDLGEKKYGDVPAPAKKDMGQVFSDEFNARERALLADHGFDFQLTDAEKQILKLSDLFDGLFSSGDELMMGNSYASEAFSNYHKYLKDYLERPELDADVRRNGKFLFSCTGVE